MPIAPSFRRPSLSSRAGASNLRLFSHEKAKRDQEIAREKTNRRSSVHRGKHAVVDMTRIFIATGTMPRSTQAARLIARRIRGERLSCREHCYLALEEPASGTTALVISVLVRLITFLATVSTVCESVPNLVEQFGRDSFVRANFLFNTIFTVEAAARVAAYSPFEHVA